MKCESASAIREPVAAVQCLSLARWIGRYRYGVGRLSRVVDRAVRDGS